MVSDQSPFLRDHKCNYTPPGLMVNKNMFALMLLTSSTLQVEFSESYSQYM